MNNTCIQHPARDPLIVIRKWQLDFCEGNHCAGVLLSFFEYWHNIRLDISQRAGPANAAARQHGKPATQDESLLQFHSDEQLQAGLLDLYGTKKIREGRRLLVTKGAITEHPNPNPRYAFDKTLYFEFHPEVINAWLDQRRNPAPPDQNALSGDDNTNNVTSGKNAERVGKNAERVGKNAERVGKNADSYTETTTETTTEITTTTPNPSSTDEGAAEPEAAERGGGVRDKNPEDRDGGQEPAIAETTEQNPVSRVSATDERLAELAYPAKLTEREREDIAAQVEPLPAEVAQQMLDVIDAKIRVGQIKTNPAAVLRGIVRKYRADPAAFDPSNGFQIAEARHRREDAKARQRAEAERREREAARASPAAREVMHRSIAAMKQILRGHA